MKIQFDSHQDYQLQAIRSVVKLFEGQPLAKSDFEISFTEQGDNKHNQTSTSYDEKGVGNNLVLTDVQLLENIKAIQRENNIALAEKAEKCFFPQDKKQIEEWGVPKNHYNIPNQFTIEMETGTGKTYTFLRTVYELNKVYGFKKFVIVVPSVAIKEGTIKNLEITAAHFQGLYNNPPINHILYDRNNLVALRNFATSNAIQLLVINADSFAKDSNVINTMRETGVKPIEYISSTNPIVIIDEPQNFETDVRKQALANLNPMCCLRYSATHRNLYNLIYSLNPVQAYDLGLVKQIEVDGIITTNTDYNAAFIQFKSIVSGKKSLKVKLCIYVQALFEVKQKDVLVEIGNDLFVLSGERDIYKHGFELNSINAAEGFIEFSNGLTIRMGETTGGLTDEIMRYQIERTVKHHFDKIKSLKNKQVKVLSLFFIDRVANYRSYDAEGAASGGKFAEWFEAAFTKYQKNNPDVLPFSVETVHNGYFSSDKTSKNKGKNERIWIDSKEKNTQKDDDTYSLIMRDKERLLSLEESLQFIFSHSALREGWDNPNVFQICTLNESKSELKKRQEIGRGLRLPVDSAGQRIHDKRINVLTVIANETYESFSKALQKEIETDTSVVFGDRVGDKNKKQKVVLNKELTLENCPLLFEIWEKISHKTRYSVEFSTEELIRRSVEILKNMPKLNRPSLQSSTAMLIITEDGVEGRVREKSMKRLEIKENYQIPDVYSYIQARVEVTRPTIFQLLMQSDRYEDLEVNPQLYLDNVVAAIKTSLNRLLVEGVKYEIINGQHYEMSLFNDEELEDLLTNLFKVSNFDKTVFNYIPIDSSIERKFAHDCEVDTSVKFFFKLPRGFKIPTPIGNYIPDWAVIFEGDSRIYFVAETKSTLDKDSLRNIETMKIHCGTQHFASLTPQNVTYKMVTSVEELRN